MKPNQINLPPEIIDRAIQIMNRPETLSAAVRELGVPRSQLMRNLERSGRRNQTPLVGAWDENISNKYLVMKLRQPA